MAEKLKEDDDKREVVEIELNEEERKTLVAEEEQHTDEDHDEEDGEEADERVVRSSEDEGSEDDREAIRERRRKEKQERKERREKAIARDKLELEFLRKRNDDLERRVTAQEQRTQKSDLAAYDAHIKKATDEVQLAERVIAKATAAGNGEDVVQAMRYRDEAMARANQLTAQKKRAEAEAKKQSVQQSNAIDPDVAAHAQQFVKDHAWYDPQGRDEDSAIVLAIDSAMVKDGYDPKSEDYWTELRKRIARRLPEKTNGKPNTKPNGDGNGSERREARGGPAIGGGKEHAPTSTRKEVYISAERKQALMDAGVWDDPVLRAKYVKRYMEYDRNNRA